MHTKDDFMGLSKSPESPSSTKENEKENGEKKSHPRIPGHAQSSRFL